MVIKLTTMVSAILIMDMRMIGLETFIPFLLFLRILSAMKYSKDKYLFFNTQKYTKLLCLEFIFLFLLFSCHSNQKPIGDKLKGIHSEKSDTNIIVGAEQLDLISEHIKGRSIAVVGNQSSILNNGVHIVDTLLSLNHKLIKVFSPEHGFRGKGSAGEHISNSKDPKTGLPIVSLYGSHKKPSSKDLEGIELLIFDIQDVGVRFYTYISTLHYVMEACAENNIPLIILDRPNPNGDYVDGPILELKYKSFVGMHPVPIVHGMTIGEYGKMINGQFWMKDSAQCKLEVIPCKNYSHHMNYSLPVPPSPNLKSDASIRLYPSLCLLEATSVSVGRGTSSPFEWFGHPKFPEQGLSFIPKSIEGASHPKHENVKCNAFKPVVDFEKKKINLDYVIKSYHLLKEDFMTKNSFFNKLAGTDRLFEQIASGMSQNEIRNSWNEGLDKFKAVRARYLIYD